MAVSHELYRTLTPTGAKSITSADWDQQLSSATSHSQVFTSLTTKLLELYDLMPTQANVTVDCYQKLADLPIIEEAQQLFTQLPSGFRPICTRSGDIVLIAMRIAAHLTLHHGGRSH